MEDGNPQVAIGDHDHRIRVGLGPFNVVETPSATVTESHTTVPYVTEILKP